MRKSLAAVAVVSALGAAPTAALAEDPASFSANVGLFSDYVFRGVSQTGEEPAIQGGFDFGYNFGPASLYLGTWASNISWLEDSGLYTESSMEWDFYGGVTGMFGSTDFGYDVGIIYYYYPGTKLPGTNSADTTELYAGVSWKWAKVKYSYAVSDYFGFTDSDGTWYLDFSVAYPIGDTGLTVDAHYGILEVENDPGGAGELSYNDWKIGVNYTIPTTVLKGVNVGLYYTDTDAEDAPYTINGNVLADDRVVVFVKKTF
ncbi:MAG TPA: TorF family putative porin [Pelomicrobium sp.]|nr:TorF family putative porin [Pelomicrobium sp.]